MADDLSFSDLVDFLADHEGEKVYVEIGTRYPGSDTDDAFVLKLHGKKLGAIQDAVDVRTDEKKAVMVRLFPHDEPIPEDEKETAASRIFFSPEQVTVIQGDGKRSVKVWIEDTFYVSLS
jgi:hypothetical protein